MGGVGEAGVVRVLESHGFVVPEGFVPVVSVPDFLTQPNITRTIIDLTDLSNSIGRSKHRPVFIVIDTSQYCERSECSRAVNVVDDGSSQRIDEQDAPFQRPFSRVDHISLVIKPGIDHLSSSQVLNETFKQQLRRLPLNSLQDAGQGVVSDVEAGGDGRPVGGGVVALGDLGRVFGVELHHVVVVGQAVPGVAKGEEFGDLGRVQGIGYFIKRVWEVKVGVQFGWAFDARCRLS